MRSKVLALFCVIGLLLPAKLAAAQHIEYLEAKPLIEVVQGKAQPVSTMKIGVPLITWGGDVATILASTSGIFENNGLDVELFLENNFTKQVEACLSGKTPYLRGTLGMINGLISTLS